MYTQIETLAYIDLNTSQHVFSLIGPILTFLSAITGLAVAGFLFVRRRAISYLRNASWTKRIATVPAGIGLLAVVGVIVCRLLW